MADTPISTVDTDTATSSDYVVGVKADGNFKRFGASPSFDQLSASGGSALVGYLPSSGAATDVQTALRAAAATADLTGASTATPTSSDTVLGVQGGVVKRFTVNDIFPIYMVKSNGAVGDDSTDDTTAIQTSMDEAEGGTLLLEPGKTYKCTSALVAKGNVLGNGSMLKFYGTTIAYLVSISQVGNLLDFTIDGTNVTNCTSGLFVDTDFAQSDYCYYDLVVQNISTADNTSPCSGAQFFKGSGATNLKSYLDIKVQVTSVTATADGVGGNNGGKASGILVGFNAANCDGNVVIHDSVVDGVSSGGAAPSEDADGIHLQQANHTTDARGLFRIVNCITKDCKKRGYKIQAANTLVDNCICFGQNTLGGFETYALHTTFRNCKYLLGAHVGFTSSWTYTKFINCYAESSTTALDVCRIYGDGDYAVIDGCDFKATGAFATGDYGVVQVYEASEVTISNSRLLCTSDAGCSLLMRAAATVSVENSLLSGSSTGVNLWGSTGRLRLQNVQISAATNCLSRTANTDQSVYVYNSRLISAAGAVIDFYNSAGANAAYAEVYDSYLQTGNGHGAYLSTGSIIKDCRIVATVVAGNGVWMRTNNTVCRNNRIEGFSVGIDHANTTNTEVVNNVTIDCTTEITNTSATPLVEADNHSR